MIEAFSCLSDIDRQYRKLIPTFNGSLSLLLTASREKAFVHAITSAAVVHQVTRACRRGELRNCSCDKKTDGRSNEEFNWGGCSDNIAYGLRTAKLFVDSFEKETDAKAMMNLHNNLVGRRVS